MGHWTDPTSIAGKLGLPPKSQPAVRQRNRALEYVDQSKPDSEVNYWFTDVATDMSKDTNANAATEAFRETIEEFKATIQQSDDKLVECAQRFSRALRFFVDRAVIPKQNEKMLRETGALVQRLYEQEQEYVRLVRVREELQNKHHAYLDRIEADPMSRKLRAKHLTPWRHTLSQMLTSRKVQDLDECMERVDRLIGLAQPGWSLQTLRTQDLLRPQASDDQAADDSKGLGPQWQLRYHKQLQSEGEPEAAGIAPTWSFEALKQQERLVEHRLQLQEQREKLQIQRQTQHFNKNKGIKNGDLISYSDEEL